MRVNQIAAAHGATATQVAIAWVLAHQQRSVIVPILGARTRQQIEDNLRALDLELTSKELARLDKVSRIERVFPHDFLGRNMAYGGTYALVDAHLWVPESRSSVLTWQFARGAVGPRSSAWLYDCSICCSAR